MQRPGLGTRDNMEQNMSIGMEGSATSPPTDRDCGTVGEGLSAGGGVKETTD